MAFSSPLAIVLLLVYKPDFFLKPLYQLSVISYQLSDLSFQCAVCMVLRFVLCNVQGYKE
ncbi:hypothetical protein MICAH_4260025 [Microcystis aeruginosa PCC 9809]|uniref:Uncharacterized protein n=1 Tax=Microcystis aeruginosa PCC 9809 TaxID=1160285 RepID=I4HYR1_MICAE|nr:hypothetical protein MICAH_4260025 [Microcystis aeruginosa PCC 9809]